MAYRRKRRSRGTWLQTLGSIIDESATHRFNGIAFQVPVDPTQFITTIMPVTTDAPTYDGDAVTDETIMGDVIGNEYFLDRIVGKLFLTATQGETTVPGVHIWYPILVGAGFFVARADDGNPSQPVGSTGTELELEKAYSPLEAQNIREPWIWRRTWVLGKQGQMEYLGNGGDLAGSFPVTNALYGSVLDGPHIDAKTKRRVGQDDRLWFALSTSYIPGMGRPGVNDIEENQAVFAYLDFRLHGALRKARQTGRF